MASQDIKEYVKKNTDKFEYFYQHTAEELNKMSEDAKYLRKNNYIVLESKSPQMTGIKATKLTEERKNKLETLTLLKETEKLLKNKK